MCERVRRFREWPPQSRAQRSKHVGGPIEPGRCRASCSGVQAELEQSADALLLAAQRALQKCSSRATGAAPAAGTRPEAAAGAIGGPRMPPVHDAGPAPADEDILESWRRRRALQQARCYH